MLDVLSKIIGPVLDNVFETDAEKATAKAKLLSAENEVELKKLAHEIQLRIAEAKSDDPYVRRARPTVLYLTYALIGSALPFGVLHMFSPEHASALMDGIRSYYASIPVEMYNLMTAGLVSYFGARSFDKSRLLKAGQ